MCRQGRLFIVNAFFYGRKLRTGGSCFRYNNSGKYRNKAEEECYGAGTYQIPTQEDYKELCRYISETKKWTSPIDTELHYILNEETLAYLAGEISLDTAVDTLQNRISTWLSEKYD